MSQKNNETPALIAALVATALLVGGAGWWLTQSGILGGNPSTEVSSTDGEADSSFPTGSTGGSLSDVSSVPEGTFTYGGSTTWAPLRGTLDPKISSALPTFQLAYRDANSSSAGIELLTNGELDFAQSSRPLNSAEKRRAQQKGIQLKEVPVALEAVAIATHPDIDIPGLTLTQLKDIYTGNITNWNQVGGLNLAIKPASRSADGGTVQYFQEDILNGESFSSGLTILGTTTEAIRFVGATPGAIYFASAPEIVGQCTVAPLPIGTSARELVPPYRSPYVPSSDCPSRRNELNLEAFQAQTYPLLRPLYVVMRRGDGSVSEQAGTTYTNILKTEEGQDLLLQAGFVPLP